MLDHLSSSDGLLLPTTVLFSNGAPGGRPTRSGPAGRADDPGPVVLVVEDDADARDAMAELLEHEGFPAKGVANGREALELLRSGRPVSLVLLDLTMPIMNGWDFCEELAQDERTADLPVAILTASATYTRLPARRCDAGLFVKPVDFDRLLQTVRRYSG